MPALRDPYQAFDEFEIRKELDGGAVGRGFLLWHGTRLFAMRRVGGDTKVIFGEAGVRNVRNWADKMIDAKRLEKSMRSQN